jgi:putative nucleotidyltransferase with HDIG domain
MLSREESIRLLAEYGQGAGWTRHCHAVAEMAARVGKVLAPRRAVDAAFLWSAALLHDIGRCETHDPIRHGVAGYRLLTALGHAREAHVCAAHILFGLEAAEAAQFGLPGRDFVPEGLEEKLVALVDFLVEVDRPTTLAQRFASLRRRNTDNAFFLERLNRAQDAARRFMTGIETEMGVSVEGIVATREV